MRFELGIKAGGLAHCSASQAAIWGFWLRLCVSGGKTTTAACGAVGDATVQPKTTIIKTLDPEERLNHTKCTETPELKKSVITSDEDKDRKSRLN